MRAGTEVPATPGGGAADYQEVPERSMRAGTEVPATPTEDAYQRMEDTHAQ